MTLSLVHRVLALALVALGLTGCSRAAVIAPRQDAAPPIHALEASSSGWWVVRDAPAAWTEDVLVRILPRTWPADAIPPTLGFGRLVLRGGELALLPTVLRRGLPPEALRVELTEGAAALEEGKELLQVRRRSEDTLEMEGGQRVGVVLHDVYAILGPERPGQHELAARIVALGRVVEVDEDSATLRIEHARKALPSHALALFLQLRREAPAFPQTLLFALPEGVSFPEATYFQALQTRMERLGLSNIGIEVRPFSGSVTTYEAAWNLRNEAPEGRSGVLLALEPSPEGVTLQLSTFGGNSDAYTVGILPGGMPLAGGLDDDVVRSSLLDIGLATVLALRGDQARALYATLLALDGDTLPPLVVSHLREHLALRYLGLGRPFDGLWLMDEDVVWGEGLVEDAILRNALSIRAALRRDLGAHSTELEDISRYVALTRAHLPNEPVLLESLQVASALRSLGELDQAADVIADVLLGWTPRLGLGSLYIAASQLAVVESLRDDAAASRLAFTVLDPHAQALTVGQRAMLAILQAELLFRAGDQRQAVRVLAEIMAQDHEALTVDERMSLYERSALLFMELGEARQSLSFMGRALQAALADHRHLQLRDLLRTIGMIELRAIGAPQLDAARMVAEARESFFLAFDLSRQLAYPADAASLLLYLASVDRQIRQLEGADRHLEEAERLARSAGAASLIAEIYHLRALVALDRGEIDEAQLLQQIGEVWAGHGAVTLPPLPEVDHSL